MTSTLKVAFTIALLLAVLFYYADPNTLAWRHRPDELNLTATLAATAAGLWGIWSGPRHTSDKDEV